MKKTNYFPLFVDLSNKTVKIFGAGKIANRRIKTLLQFGCNIKIISTHILLEIEALDSRVITIEERAYREGDCEGADLIIAATNNREVNHRIYLECEMNHIPASIADKKEECSFFFPGVVMNDDVVIGITSSGENHALVKKICQELSRLFK